MKLTQPLKWHGGKHYLTQKIVALMPPHTHYVKPYAGGLSVLLAKDPEGISEVVNDIDLDLTTFWKVMQDDGLFRKFRRIVEATPFSQHEWRRATSVIRASPVQIAAAFFIRCRQSLAGRMDAFAPLSRNRTRRGMNEQASAWLTAVEGLPTVHARLMRVVILDSMHAIDVIRQQDGPRTVFYLDPPYPHEARATTGEYAHEMTSEDHADLLNTLRGVRGIFLLSGYRNSIYEDMAAQEGWNRHEFDLPNNAASGNSKRRMMECIWTNS